MLREIRLYGELGRRFGRVHHMAVESVGEAIRALMANYRDFESALINYQPGFRVWSGPQRIGDVEDLRLPAGRRDVIRIAPVVSGAGKSALGQILIGAALVAGAILMPASIGATAMFLGTTTVSSFVGSIGVSLVLGGVVQMLSPSPKVDSGSQDTNSPSYVFNGAVNTQAQGHPVPVGYGRLIVGSAVISAGIATEDIALS